ncbi:MAG: hypothetical protein IPP69_14125 [Flavobacteriales bacterium]|nr:hypothetical protein [Flavobacteriales bacterium]
MNEGGVPIGLPEDVVDFKDLLNSLDFFASFFIKKKSTEKNIGASKSHSTTINFKPKFQQLRQDRITQ